MKWQHIGVTLTGCAALITAGIGVYEKFNLIAQPIQQKTKREYGIVDDKDGWVNLRESPNTSAPVVVKLLNGTNLEILGKHDNWCKVYTESGRVGFVYKDRLLIHYYEKQ